MTTFKKAKEQLEKVWIENTMLDCKLNQSKAAIKLGLSRGSLRTKLAKHFGNKYFRNLD